MVDLVKVNFIGLTGIIIFGLTACNSATRSDDIAAPVLATVPATVTPSIVVTEVAKETALPAEPTPVAAVTPASSEPTPATVSGPLINFKLSGGIVGFCDELSIDRTGAYVLGSCRLPDEISGTLAQPDLDLLIAWVQNLASFQLNSEDNPGGPDNLATELIFNGQGHTEADDAQKQMILDWANSLLIRTRPQAVAPPTPEPLAIGPDGLCPNITRPAVLVIDYERPGGLALIDPGSQAQCNIQLSQSPHGRIVPAAGQLYFPIFDQAAKTMTVWRLSSTGEEAPLPFTTVPMEELSPYSFAISDDGGKIAWARAVPNFAVDPPRYYNDLWVASIDGSNQVTLLNQLEQERRYVEPVIFSPDQSTLFYALQPDGLGGTIFSFSGRYNSMYSLPTAGGEPRLIFACSEAQNIICIGDISADGSALAYVQPGQGVMVLGSNGQPVSLLTPLASDYVGSPVFGPTGNLAFVSASLTQASQQDLPRPNPGVISLVRPPYTDQAQTLWSDNRVTTVWEWLDENRLIYGAMADDGNIGTGLITIDGLQLDLSPSPALAVLR